MQNTLAYYISVLRADFQCYCLEELKKWGITKGLLYFIIYIGKYPGCLPKDVSRTLQVDAGYTTRAVTKLSELGLVLRVSKEEDKRQKSLTLTEEGEYVFQKIRQLFQQWDEQITKGWTEEETELFKVKMESMILKIKKKYYI